MVSCAEGEAGFVHEGFADYETKELDLAGTPQTRYAGDAQSRQFGGRFLASGAFPLTVSGMPGWNPSSATTLRSILVALIRYHTLTGEDAKRQIGGLTEGFQGKTEYFVGRLARGLARYWRDGWFGALTMGGRQGLYCLGCCWALFAVLVAAGMMSIPWMLLLTLAIFAEKALLHGKRTSAAVALGLVALGLIVAGAVLPLLDFTCG